MKYLLAGPEVEKLGADLVEKHHPELKILDIGYIFRDEAPNASDGELLFGQAISIDSRNWLFHRKDVMVMLCQDIWEQMDDEFKRLLLDHELCHIGIVLDDDGTVVMDEGTGRPKVKMRRHDIEEFHIIMKRYAAIYEKFREWGERQAKARMSARKQKTVEQLKAQPA